MAPRKNASKDIDISVPPKKPLSGYFHFTMERRPVIKEANPSMGIGPIAKILGEEWREMDDSEKSKYLKKAADDKERYETEKEAFLAAGGELPARKTKTASKKKSAAKGSDDSE